MSNEESTAPHWDPEPGRRMYMRSMVSGEVGWIVRRDGLDKIRLNRPNQEIVVPLNNDWVAEVDYRPLSHAQIVQVAFEADRKLLKLLGDHERARKNWGELSEKQKVAWLEQGPSNPPIRQQLYRDIVDRLSGVQS